jgi:hypothetical protein
MSELADRVARQSVNAILRHLNSLKSFDWFWEHVDKSTRAEIRRALVAIVARECEPIAAAADELHTERNAFVAAYQHEQRCLVHYRGCQSCRRVYIDGCQLFLDMREQALMHENQLGSGHRDPLAKLRS